MMVGRRDALAALAILVACRGDTRPPAPAPTRDAAAIASGPWFPDTRSIRDHVAALASPTLRGRGGGTADERAAAVLVAGWLRDAGAEPLGEDGYLAPFSYPGGKSQNVVAVIRGRDATAGHVIVGAHYDHLGVDDRGVYLGADDNASGTAGLVAIAAAMARAGQRPRRTVVLVAFGAEELGLHGSQAYVAAPARPLADAVAMINLDMIGRARFLSARDYAAFDPLMPDNAIGALISPGAYPLVDAARTVADRLGRPLVTPSDFGPLESQIRAQVEQRGDQASFATVGVPYLWLSTSMHDDYHLPSDTPDKIDPDTIATVGRIVVGVIERMPDRVALQPAPAAR